MDYFNLYKTQDSEYSSLRFFHENSRPGFQALGMQPKPKDPSISPFEPEMSDWGGESTRFDLQDSAPKTDPEIIRPEVKDTETEKIDLEVEQKMWLPFKYVNNIYPINSEKMLIVSREGSVICHNNTGVIEKLDLSRDALVCPVGGKILVADENFISVLGMEGGKLEGYSQAPERIVKLEPLNNNYALAYCRDMFCIVNSEGKVTSTVEKDYRFPPVAHFENNLIIVCHNDIIKRFELTESGQLLQKSEFSVFNLRPMGITVSKDNKILVSSHDEVAILSLDGKVEKDFSVEGEILEELSICEGAIIVLLLRDGYNTALQFISSLDGKIIQQTKNIGGDPYARIVKIAEDEVAIMNEDLVISYKVRLPETEKPDISELATERKELDTEAILKVLKQMEGDLGKLRQAIDQIK